MDFNVLHQLLVLLSSPSASIHHADDHTLVPSFRLLHHLPLWPYSKRVLETELPSMLKYTDDYSSECRMGAGDRIVVAITGAYIFAFIRNTYNIPTARTITWLYSSHREEGVVRFEDASEHTYMYSSFDVDAR
ncbi:hypothetical protein BHE74_00059241 [Ensete ventricosum]|nr:hypothetical protein GW17_00061622 [Ensete ventricosum]RWW35787.1 hypothetical protein BHE74_00059241 [Ensete ventricosum]